jgi:hypothetical protein
MQQIGYVSDMNAAHGMPDIAEPIFTLHQTLGWGTTGPLASIGSREELEE